MCFLCGDESIETKIDKEMQAQSDEHDRFRGRGKYHDYSGDEYDSGPECNRTDWIIYQCDKLTEVPCMDPTDEVTELEVSDCPNLTTIHASRSIWSLTVRNCPNLTTIYSGYCTIKVINCPKLTTIHPSDDAQSIQIVDCPSLLIEQVPIDCTNADDILFPALTEVLYTLPKETPQMVYRLRSGKQ